MGISTRKKQSSKAASSAPAKKEMRSSTRAASTASSHSVIPPSPNPSVGSDIALATAMGKQNSISATDFFKTARSAKYKPPTLKFDFASLGIDTAAPALSRQAKNYTSTIHCATITGQAVVFRIQSVDATKCAYAEKIMMDHHYVYNWYNHDVKQLNAGGFGVRIFVIYVQDTNVSTTALISLGQHIANISTGNPDNGTVVVVPDDPNEFIWLRNATWQEVIGTEAALSHLKFRTTSTAFYKGYYQKYTKEVHKHFRKGTFTVELAFTLHAPIDCISAEDFAVADVIENNQI
jgi:hypothetical protein